MTEILLYVSAALVSYLISGLNPAIILSNLIYKRDIRNEGSGNPGFTNFKRVFGNKFAWFVFALDIIKAAIPFVVFGFLFDKYLDARQFGVAYAGVFAFLGHVFPCWYGFKGGKGFLVNLATIWFIDWRAGIIATVVMVVLVLVIKYMSVATMVALVLAAISLLVFTVDSIWIFAMYMCCVLFMIYKHKENIKRLMNGTESKFHLK